MDLRPLVVAGLACVGVGFSALQAPSGNELRVSIDARGRAVSVQLRIEGVPAPQTPRSPQSTPIHFVVHGTNLHVVALPAPGQDSAVLTIHAQLLGGTRLIASGSATGEAVSVSSHGTAIHFAATPRALAPLLRQPPN